MNQPAFRMGLRAVRAASLAGLAVCAIGGACALPGYEKVTGDAGTAGAASGCPHALPPKRPTTGDPGGSLDLVFAVKTVDFGEADPAGGAGLDLDHTCTCTEAHQEGQCELPPFVTSGMTPCDPPDGRDNAVTAIIQQSKMYLMQGSPEFTQGIAMGQWSLLVRVTEYDGSANDSSVKMSVYMTPGRAGMPPVWDGTDTWPVRPESLAAPMMNVDLPVVVDPNAFVADHVLVGVVSGEFEVNGGLRVRLGSGFLMGTLVNDGAWRIDDGVLAGTWQANDALIAVGNLKVLGIQLCQQAAAFLAVKTAVCQGVDIASAPSLPCDSLSFGMKLTAGAAQLGAIAMPATELPPCPPVQCGP